MMKLMFLIVFITIFSGLKSEADFDICFNMESSQDITENQWLNAKFFVTQIIDELISNDFVGRVSAVKYDGLATIVSGLKNDLPLVKQLINSQQRGHRLDGFTLNGVRECLNVLRDGKYASESSELTQYLVTISDGKMATGPVTACVSDFQDADGKFSHAKLCGPCDGNYFTDQQTMQQRIENNGIQTLNVYYDYNSDSDLDTSWSDCLSSHILGFDCVDNLFSVRRSSIVSVCQNAVEMMSGVQDAPSSVRRLISRARESHAIENIIISNNNDHDDDNENK